MYLYLFLSLYAIREWRESRNSYDLRGVLYCQWIQYKVRIALALVTRISTRRVRRLAATKISKELSGGWWISRKIWSVDYSLFRNVKTRQKVLQFSEKIQRKKNEFLGGDETELSAVRNESENSRIEIFVIYILFACYEHWRERKRWQILFKWFRDRASQIETHNDGVWLFFKRIFGDKNIVCGISNFVEKNNNL